jgi:hypothetical protein
VSVREEAGAVHFDYYEIIAAGSFLLAKKRSPPTQDPGARSTDVSCA